MNYLLPMLYASLCSAMASSADSEILNVPSSTKKDLVFTASLISTIRPPSETVDSNYRVEMRGQIRRTADDGCLTHLYEAHITGIDVNLESTLKGYGWGVPKNVHVIKFKYTPDGEGLYSVRLEKILTGLILINKKCIDEIKPQIFPHLYNSSNTAGYQLRSPGKTKVCIDLESSDPNVSENEIYLCIKDRLDKQLSNAVLYPYEVDFLLKNNLHLGFMLPAR